VSSGLTSTSPRQTDEVSSPGSSVLNVVSGLTKSHLAAAAEIDILFEQGVPARKWKGTDIAHLMASRED